MRFRGRRPGPERPRRGGDGRLASGRSAPEGHRPRAGADGDRLRALGRLHEATRHAAAEQRARAQLLQRHRHAGDDRRPGDALRAAIVRLRDFRLTWAWTSVILAVVLLTAAAV